MLKKEFRLTLLINELLSLRAPNFSLCRVFVEIVKKRTQVRTEIKLMENIGLRGLK